MYAKSEFRHERNRLGFVVKPIDHPTPARRAREGHELVRISLAGASTFYEFLKQGLGFLSKLSSAHSRIRRTALAAGSCMPKPWASAQRLMVLTHSLVFLGLTMFCASNQAVGDVVVVSVPRTAQVQSELVQLGEIADVTGGNPALRRQIAQLDIVEQGAPGVTAKLTIKQIALRVRLSGVPRGAFVVTGGPRVHVSWASKELNDLAVLESLRPKLADRFNVSPGDLELRLTRPLRSSDSERVGGEFELRPFLPAVVRTGPVHLKVGIYQDNQLAQTIGVSVDVRIWRRVFVTNRRVAAGEALTDEVVRLERRALTGRDASDFAESVTGQSSRRTLRAGTVVLRSDVTQPKPANTEIVIRNRDTVALTARKGNLEVSLLGAEALQQGRVGDTIRVKNPHSGKIIAARVVDASTVELRL